MATNLFDLTGKVVLVTGGNAGIGLGFARGFAKAGADIVIWGRREERNRIAAEELCQYSGRVLSAQVDVTDEQAVIAATAKAIAKFGRLDCVVANAGFAAQSPFVDMSTCDLRAMLDVALFGGFYTLREVARHMVQRADRGDAGGSLIICGSLSIFRGVPQMAHYAAAKGALNSLCKTLAVELGPRGIRVNVVAPGFILTEIAADDEEQTRAYADHISATAPLRRVGYGADMEGVGVYLASDMSAYHTGDVLVIDGGRLASN